MFTMGQSIADEIHVAVASNFAEVMTEISKQFEASTGHRVVLSFGSTGKHYAQIRNGAPFDAFFAADVHRPELLEEEGVAVPGSRFTYAIGKLVLWSPKKNYVDSTGMILIRSKFRYLAIANPKLAPYGKAAREVLQALGLWDLLKERIVQGENISQAFQYVKSGNTELGFIAFSQIMQLTKNEKGSIWDVPQELYTPIEQQAVLLKDGETARSFLSFVRSKESRKIILDYGYDTP